MIRFEYQRPDTEEACLQLLAQYGGRARLLAGGTDLLVELRADDEKHRDVGVLLDTTRIGTLRFVEEDRDTIHLGPALTHEEIWQDPLLQRYVPFLCQACHTVGSPQIRHSGTIGGSIGTASPASDPLPPLVALGARVTLARQGGHRTVALEELLLGPYRTGRAPEEMITRISFPRPDPAAKTAFVKLGRRKALAISRMNVAVYVSLDGGGVARDVRIVPGSCLPVAARIPPAEEMLRGNRPDAALHEAIGRRVAEEMVAVCGRRWSTPYKEPVIASLVKRALEEATGGTDDA